MARVLGTAVRADPEFVSCAQPDLAALALGRVRAPTLLIVGGDDTLVLELNRRELRELGSPIKELAVVPGAAHLFEEPGALESRVWRPCGSAGTSVLLVDVVLAGARACVQARRQSSLTCSSVTCAKSR